MVAALVKPLVVRIEDLETGEAWVYAFDHGPVVLGRGEEVALPVARSFVSLQHCSFDFDGVSISFVDLDSRNGTTVDGMILAGGECLLTEASDVRIGPARISVSRAMPDRAPPDPASSPFARAGAAAKKLEPKPETDRISHEMLAAYRAKLPAAKPSAGVRRVAEPDAPPSTVPGTDDAAPSRATPTAGGLLVTAVSKRLEEHSLLVPVPVPPPLTPANVLPFSGRPASPSPTPDDPWPPPRDPSFPPTAVLPQNVRHLAWAHADPVPERASGGAGVREAPPDPAPLFVAGGTRVIPDVIVPAERQARSFAPRRRSRSGSPPIKPAAPASFLLRPWFWLLVAAVGAATVVVGLLVLRVLG